MSSEAPQKLSLLDHLVELRARLIRALLAVVVLGGVSLAFAKPIFHILVLPILRALPAGQRALIQTSAVEQLNTLIKVGLYTGVFLSAPVILWQIWGFVSPGLYANERRMATPFVVAGTLCFLAGATFCYFVVLPPAFQFLLQPEDTQGRTIAAAQARGELDDVGRLLRAGDLIRADALLRGAEHSLADLPGADATEPAALLARADRLDPLLDAVDRAAARSGQGREELARAIELRSQARASALDGKGGEARKGVESAELLAAQALEKSVGGAEGEQAGALGRRVEAASSRLAAVDLQLQDDDWTRPMLSMKEQLNLVLVLLLAFGVIFEIPVVFALLAAMGLITGEGLAKHRRYAIVINVIVAAVVTPTGDPLNLSLMAVPMILCYEAGVLAAKIITKRRRAREAAALAT